MLRFVASLCLVATFAGAQQVLIAGNERRAAVAATVDGLVLPAGQLTLVELLEAVAGFLCRSYLYDFDALGRADDLRLSRALALDATGAEEVLLAALAARGFLALPIDEPRGIFQVIDLGTPQRSVPVPPLPWRTAEEIERRPRLRELVLTALPIDNVDAAVLANAMRDFYSLQGAWHPGVPTATAVGPRLLLLYGFRDQLAPAIAAVRQLDRLAGPSATTTPAAAAADHAAMRRRLDALEREVADLRARVAERR